MTTISFQVNDDESKIIHDYVSVNKLNMNQFIRDAVLDKIESDFELDEVRILNALIKIWTRKQIWSYWSLEDVWCLNI